MTLDGATTTMSGENTSPTRSNPTMNRRRVVSAVRTRMAGTTPRNEARESVNAKGMVISASSASIATRIRKRFVSSAMPPAIAMRMSR